MMSHEIWLVGPSGISYPFFAHCKPPHLYFTCVMHILQYDEKHISPKLDYQRFGEIFPVLFFVRENTVGPFRIGDLSEETIRNPSSIVAKETFDSQEAFSEKTSLCCIAMSLLNIPKWYDPSD